MPPPPQRMSLKIGRSGPSIPCNPLQSVKSVVKRPRCNPLHLLFRMQPPLLPAALLLPLLLLASCAGYHLGNPKPATLARIKSIAVPMFNNDTQHPKAEVLATSAVASALTQDGTFHLTSCEHADAILSGHLKNISYSSIRGSRLDTVHPEELTNTVTLAWTLTDAKNPRLILATGSSLGTSQLFVDPDLQTARNNALPDALERAAEALVSRLANGF